VAMANLVVLACVLRAIGKKGRQLFGRRKVQKSWLRLYGSWVHPGAQMQTVTLTISNISVSGGRILADRQDF